VGGYVNAGPKDTAPGNSLEGEGARVGDGVGLLPTHPV
jgi:hypothetical protein